MDYKMKFAKRLIALREENNLTQQQLADKLNISRQSLSLYEKAERTINIELLAQIADFFNVSTDYLLCRTDTASMNEDLQNACKVTGLSEKAVISLKEIIQPRLDDNLEELKRCDIVNACITEPMFSAVFDSIVQLVRWAEAYSLTDLTKDIDTKDKLKFNWSKEYIISKYVTDEAFKHFCDNLIENITGLDIDELYNETIIDLRYFRRAEHGEHNPETE